MLLLYKPPLIPTITIPTIWNGNNNPENPHGERKPFISITKAPSVAPNITPKTPPTKKTIRDVNSTFGGRGVNCIDMHIAVKTAKSMS